MRTLPWVGRLTVAVTLGRYGSGPGAQTGPVAGYRDEDLLQGEKGRAVDREPRSRSLVYPWPDDVVEAVAEALIERHAWQGMVLAFIPGRPLPRGPSWMQLLVYKWLRGIGSVFYVWSDLASTVFASMQNIHPYSVSWYVAAELTELHAADAYGTVAFGVTALPNAREFRLWWYEQMLQLHEAKEDGYIEPNRLLSKALASAEASGLLGPVFVVQTDSCFHCFCRDVKEWPRLSSALARVCAELELEYIDEVLDGPVQVVPAREAPPSPKLCSHVPVLEVEKLRSWPPAHLPWWHRAQVRRGAALVAAMVRLALWPLAWLLLAARREPPFWWLRRWWWKRAERRVASRARSSYAIYLFRPALHWRYALSQAVCTAYSAMEEPSSPYLVTALGATQLGYEEATDEPEYYHPGIIIGSALLALGQVVFTCTASRWSTPTQIDTVPPNHPGVVVRHGKHTRACPPARREEDLFLVATGSLWPARFWESYKTSPPRPASAEVSEQVCASLRAVRSRTVQEILDVAVGPDQVTWVVSERRARTLLRADRLLKLHRCLALPLAFERLLGEDIRAVRIGGLHATAYVHAVR